jgi:hypothetical protein
MVAELHVMVFDEGEPALPGSTRKRNRAKNANQI